jgi:nucleotide-binding universal stress UspA family protein
VDHSPKIERILFATDFLESSRLALDYAVAFAHHFRATIHMLHVLELSQAAREAESTSARPSISRKAAEDRLEAFAAGVRRAGIEVETQLNVGIPADEVLAESCSGSFDLLVIGVHGVHRGLDHLIIGSNAEKILLSSSCPVLTVGAHVMAGLDLELRVNEVLYIADLTPESAFAAPYAVFLGHRLGVKIDVAQLLPDDAELAEKAAQIYCEVLKQRLGDAYPTWQEPAFQLERGLGLEGIVRRAESEHASLIVLGVQTPTRLDRHLHASFAYELVARATCPVLSIACRDGARSNEA